jgi:hypothetical protein
MLIRQLLDSLGERFNTLGEGSRSMVAQVCIVSQNSKKRNAHDWNHLGKENGCTAKRQVVVWVLNLLITNDTNDS